MSEGAFHIHSLIGLTNQNTTMIMEIETIAWFIFAGAGIIAMIVLLIYAIINMRRGMLQ